MTIDQSLDQDQMSRLRAIAKNDVRCLQGSNLHRTAAFIQQEFVQVREVTVEKAYMYLKALNSEVSLALADDLKRS